MAKKFKDELPEAEAAGPDMRITLLAYINRHAPDALTPLAVMEGASALRFWQETFQPAQPGEGKKLLKDAVRWPYAERLAYLAREFIKLDDRRRRYIVKAARAQIWWRGDDLQRFRVIVEAHLDYRRLNEDERSGYRKRLMNAAKAIAGGQAAP